MMKYIILLLLSFRIAVCFANGPTPPYYLYRLDTRTPDQIFGTRAASGPGFQTWAQVRNIPANYDLLDYFSALTVSPAPFGDRNAGWVSTTGSSDGIRSFLELEILGARTDWPILNGALAVQPYWLYEISTPITSQVVHANTALTDAVSNPQMDINIMSRALMLLNTFASVDEWVVRDGINTRQIAVAYRYDYNPAIGFFDHNYQDPTATVQNPHYSPEPGVPVPWTTNPVSQSAISTNQSVVAYSNATSHELPQSNPAVPATTTVTMSCAGQGATNSPSAKTVGHSGANNNSDAGPVKGCDYSSARMEKIEPKQFPTIASRIVVKAHTGNNYCLRPTNVATTSLLGTRSYLYLDNCTGTNDKQAIYDETGRITYVSDDYGLTLCLTAPENVIGGSDPWDWVQFWPCDINNPYQKWTIFGGKIHPDLNKSLYIQDSKYYGIISKKLDGYDNNLVPSEMTDGFFKTRSKISNSAFEIGLSFIYPSDGIEYYPSKLSDFFHYSANYLQRSYFEPETKRIMLINYFPSGGTAYGWGLQCLTSALTSGDNSNWNWAVWNPCTSNPSSVPKSQTWIMDTTAGTSPFDNIRFSDAGSNKLYVSYAPDTTFGRLLTTAGSAPFLNSTSLFRANRTYGGCLKSDGSWQACNTPKHTTQENDLTN